jgi:subfamily B ATP-binding cassette protein MsbA
MAAADRYFDLIDTDTSIKESENPIKISEFNDSITFNNIHFAYEDKTLFEGLDFTIKKGEVVAVVGETGSGKTTIANLIARFYDVSSGSVMIDGINVKDMELASLRSLIGVVTQDPLLFNDTIASNIAYSKEDASMDEIIAAAKQANAHEFIVDGRHPEGYDTVVGEKGSRLSGGEKQRISIARAMLKNPPIMILDEATSALDTVTERLVQDALNHLMESRTVFAIAHRLSTIQHADKIIVLEAGSIIESGTHDELLKLNGKYKKLNDMQFGMAKE